MAKANPSEVEIVVFGPMDESYRRELAASLEAIQARIDESNRCKDSGDDTRQ